MPRKKEIPVAVDAQSSDVLQSAPMYVSVGEPPRVGGLVRRFSLQFLCGSLTIALGLVTLLYLNERRVSNSDPHGAASTNVNGGIDTASDDAVLQAVANLMILPAEPEPIIALVADAERLRTEQAFYRGAENGDMLLVFPQSRQAVVYRPSSNKIVNVGPLIVDGNE
jgi:hypothetical protein